mmetsp:Transcript_11738/g.29008  ORF Transcript_11738/g.29008 Transcript_11738/m.29008 type:complete len:83 (-) Transcript_11738:1131-1379(-)
MESTFRGNAKSRTHAYIGQGPSYRPTAREPCGLAMLTKVCPTAHELHFGGELWVLLRDCRGERLDGTADVLNLPVERKEGVD